jgi:hypothetical protein
MADSNKKQKVDAAELGEAKVRHIKYGNNF